MNLLKMMREHVAEEFEKNMHYEALTSDAEREAFVDAIIDNMKPTELLEKLSWALSQALQS